MFGMSFPFVLSDFNQKSGKGLAPPNDPPVFVIDIGNHDSFIVPIFTNRVRNNVDPSCQTEKDEVSVHLSNPFFVCVFVCVA